MANFKAYTKDLLPSFEEIFLDEVELANGYKKLLVNGSIGEWVSYSEDLNKTLEQNRDWEIKFTDKLHQTIRKNIKERKDQLFPFLLNQFSYKLERGIIFFNSNLLCLSNDIDVNNPFAFCHSGTYFDSFLCNQVYGRQLVSKGNQLIADASAFYPTKVVSGKHIFLSLTESDLNHHIGISTLAITKDNFLVIYKQGVTSMNSAALKSPTGSGACEFSDIRKGENGRVSLLSTIIYAMERELLEESGIRRRHTNTKTKILGAFRWGKRGGKPEFVGITRLDVYLGELMIKTEEVEQLIAHPTPNWDTFKKTIHSLLSDPPLSVPLFMILFFIKQRYFSKWEGKTSLKAFLFE